MLAAAGSLAWACGSASGGDAGPTITSSSTSRSIASPSTVVSVTSTTSSPANATTTTTPMAEELARRDPPCRLRDPGDSTDEEFPFNPPDPLESSVVAEAELVRARGWTGSDTRTLETGVVVESGWSFPGEGVPTLSRVLAGDDPDADSLLDLDQCPVRDVFVISGDFLIAGLVNPSGWVVLDLRDQTLVADLVFLPGFVVASTHPSQPPGAWIQETLDGSATINHIRRFDVATMSLAPPLYPREDAIRPAVRPSVLDTEHGLVVELEAEVWLLDQHSGEQRAAWLPPDGLDVALLGGDDDVVWLRLGTDEIVSLDPATLTPVHRLTIPHLARMNYGFGRIWYVTLDDATDAVTMGIVDPETAEVVERAAFETYTRVGRGGPYLYNPYPRPVVDGVRFYDERSGATYQLTVTD